MCETQFRVFLHMTDKQIYSEFLFIIVGFVANLKSFELKLGVRNNQLKTKYIKVAYVVL